MDAATLRKMADDAWKRGDRDRADELHAQARRVETGALARRAAEKGATVVGSKAAPEVEATQPKRRSPHSISLIVLPKGETVQSYLAPEEAASLDLIFEELPRAPFGRRGWKVVKDRHGEGAVVTGERALGEYIHACMQDHE